MRGRMRGLGQGHGANYRILMAGDDEADTTAAEQSGA